MSCAYTDSDVQNEDGFVVSREKSHIYNKYSLIWNGTFGLYGNIKLQLSLGQYNKSSV